MDKKRIEDLIRKYFAAETTEQEEQELIIFFSDEEGMKLFPVEGLYFSQLALLSEVPEPSENFEERILSAIPQEQSKKSAVTRWLLPYTASAAAAVLAAVMISQLFFNQGQQLKDTFEDPQLAYAETMKTLRLVADNLNMGMSSGKSSINEIQMLTSIPAKELSSLQSAENYTRDKLKPINNLKKATSLFNLDNTENPK